jgi:hypothetical protein
MSSNTQLTNNSSVTLTTTAETGICATTPLSINAPGGLGQAISATVNVTAGTGTTSITARVRAGLGTGGAVLGTAQWNITAGQTDSRTITTGDNATQGTIQYTLTIQQNGASGNGEVNTAFMTSTQCNNAP